MQNVDIVIKYIYFAILKSIAIRTTKGFAFVSRNMHKPPPIRMNTHPRPCKGIFHCMIMKGVAWLNKITFN